MLRFATLLTNWRANKHRRQLMLGIQMPIVNDSHSTTGKLFIMAGWWNNQQDKQEASNSFRIHSSKYCYSGSNLASETVYRPKHWADNRRQPRIDCNSKNPISHSRTKHINILLLYLRPWRMAPSEMIEDVLTKPLSWTLVLTFNEVGVSKEANKTS